MTIHVYDANNFILRLLHEDTTGDTPRTVFNQIFPRSEPVFFIWDAPDGLKARRKIFPGYKAKRPPTSQDVLTSFELVYEVLSLTRAIQISIPGFEADDVIASVVRELAQGGNKVHIYSTDRDFLQVMNEYPTLVSADCVLKNGILLEDVRYHKTIVGDPSDNIPGIAGFGAKAWEEADKPALRHWLDCVVAERPLPPFAFGKAVSKWVSDPANLQSLRDYWQIIGFLPIPEDLMRKHIQVGTPDLAKAEALLTRFMQ